MSLNFRVIDFIPRLLSIDFHFPIIAKKSNADLIYGVMRIYIYMHIIVPCYRRDEMGVVMRGCEFLVTISSANAGPLYHLATVANASAVKPTFASSL